jgi:hypothetical protein
MVLIVVAIYSMLFLMNSPTTTQESATTLSVKLSLKNVTSLKELYNYYIRYIQFYSSSSNIDENDFTNSLNTTLTPIDDYSLYNASMPLIECPLIPPGLSSAKLINLNFNITLNELKRQLKMKQRALKLGGRWRPPYCISRHKVAIIVPYRDRLNNLELFLRHMHPFLSRQQ